MSQDNTGSAPKTNAEIKFSDLALSAEMQKAITNIGYETPSPIQAQAIPFLLEGRDILGVAQTGTGKTAAFALPILSNLDISVRDPQVLCLAPTRELAIQVAEAFQSYAKHLKGFHVLPIYGGTDYRGQIRQLERGVHVVVGTPGRVMDHIRRGTLMLKSLTTMVLDEADEMLRMGFIDDVEWILEQMPEAHQTALFSATMPHQIKKITKKYLDNPAEVTIKVKTATAPSIHQRYIPLRNNEKIDTLTRVLEVEEFDAVIIFVRTKNSTVEVAERLQARGYSATPLNGDIAQNQREKTIERLKKGGIDIIVATDVAARGLDVKRISHVINYDVPYDTESYVHRIGRTGRAGREGDAILFVNSREQRMLQAIERATRQKIERFKFPTLEALNERKIEQTFARIDAELQKDLTEYSSVISKYLKHNDVEPLLLVAAMASLEGDSKPFYIKAVAQIQEPPRRERNDRNDRNDRGRDRNDRNSRNSRDRNERGDRHERRDSRSFKNDENTETYRIEVGESHGVSKGNIVGAIANEAGIDSQYIGKIRINDGHSLVDLPEDMPSEVFRTLQNVWVCGQKLQISKGSGGSGGGNAKPRIRLSLGTDKKESYSKHGRQERSPRRSQGEGFKKNTGRNRFRD